MSWQANRSITLDNKVKILVWLFYITSVVGAFSVPLIIGILLFGEAFPWWGIFICIGASVFMIALFSWNAITAKVAMTVASRERRLLQKKLLEAQDKCQSMRIQLNNWERQIEERQQDIEIAIATSNNLPHVEGHISIAKHIALQYEYVEHRKKLQEWENSRKKSLNESEKNARERLKIREKSVNDSLQFKEDAIKRWETEAKSSLADREQALILRENELNRREKHLIDEVKENVKKQLGEERKRPVIYHSSYETDKEIWSKEKRLEELFATIDREEDYLSRLKKQRKGLESYIKNLSDNEKIIYRDVMNRIGTPSKLDLDGYEFEEKVADVLRKNHYDNVSVTQKSRDFGADITAEKGGVLYVIQCKYYSNPVGIDAIQEAYAAKEHYQAHVAVVATNSFFTRGAEKLAKDTRVLLWNGNDLAKMDAEPA